MPTVPRAPSRRLLDVFRARPMAVPEHVITRYRDRAGNLRTQLGRLHQRGGPDGVAVAVGTTLRSATAAGASFAEPPNPIHVVCQWIGNSRARRSVSTTCK